MEELPGTDGGLSSNAGDSYLPGWTVQPAGHKTDTAQDLGSDFEMKAQISLSG